VGQANISHMNRRPMNRRIVITSITLLLFASTFSCKYVMPERYVDYNKGRVPVNLPRELTASDRDSNIEKESAVIITITADGRMYVGTGHSAVEVRDLGAKIGPSLESQPEEDRIAYLAVDVAADYGQVVAACDQVRKIESARAGLLVNRVRDDWPSRLVVELPPVPDPNPDLSKLKPNPLILVAAITPDLKVMLNTEPMGEVNDLDPLNQKLQQIFRLRTEQFAVRQGYETRSDLPMSERIEKTLIIKAAKSVKYGDVVKVIDAAKAAGAHPIVLQLDEMPLLEIRQTQN
jgi:biopolymer transport protein ExbD